MGSAILLLLVAAVIGLFARRLRLPYTIGLLLAGLAMAALGIGGQIQLTPQLLFYVLLPPLLFEGALQTSWRELKRDLVPVVVLSTVGVVIAAAVASVGMHFLLSWSWQAAIIFGVILAATDPVAVLMTFKDAGIHGRVRLLVESESLLNDGVAATLFAVALTAATTGATGGGDMLKVLAVSVGGGLLAGWLCAKVCLLLAGQTTDHLIETTLTTVAAYGSFILADRVHGSGVLACVVAGLVMGSSGALDESQGVLTERGREVVAGFWDFAGFAANSMIFLLMGFAIRQVRFDRLAPIAMAAGIALTLVGRAAAVYLVSFPFARTRWSIPWPDRHVLFWGGMRGALALALVLSLPTTLPYRNSVTTAVFAAVTFSILIQGGTTMPLLRGLGLMPTKGSVHASS